MANKVYQQEETTRTFAPSGGDVTFTLTSLGAGAGRISAQETRTAPYSPLFRWSFKTTFATGTVVGEEIRIYLVGQSNSIRPNGLGTSDDAVSDEDQTRGLPLIGLVQLWTTAGNTSGNIQATGTCYVPFDDYSILVWNDSADAFSSTAADHEFSMTPIPDEVQ